MAIELQGPSGEAVESPSAASPPPYSPLEGKTVLLGVTGGIAAYRAADHTRELVRLGARVIPVLTRNAERFVSALTFSALAGEQAAVDVFDPGRFGPVPHISLAREADVFLVMPATADILAKAASGLAGDLLSALILAYDKPVLFCPSMNPSMYANPATRANLERLKAFGHRIVEPGEGGTACGEEGRGRLAPWDAIREAVLEQVAPRFLEGLHVLVTAGPTREPIDPVRYVSNRSSGLMGYALARVARRLGARVTLVSGPCALDPPHGVRVFRVETALEMLRAVEDAFPHADVLVMAAAVADYRPVESRDTKLKKDASRLLLALERTPDILALLASRRRPGQLIVGFCAETGDLEARALEKLARKGVDLLVANDVSEPGAGFDVATNRVLLISKEGEMEHLPLLYKEEVAERIWDRVRRLM